MLARVALRALRPQRVGLSLLRTSSEKNPLIEKEGSNGIRCLSTRPISPHVKIYKFPIAALSSITNRVTGCLLSVGCAGVGLAAIAIDCDIPALVEVVKTSAPMVMPVAKICVAFPLTYHYLAGVRHLIWDYTLKGLDIKSMEMSSYALFGSSAAISVALAFVSF
mmetsp:Transcript_9611/g.14398  ORF Transcript_9611/g.14398 Transcript_9611/m.14398 type:complete len:165 (-) Transcript_9611:188-682(-)